MFGGCTPPKGLDWRPKRGEWMGVDKNSLSQKNSSYIPITTLRVTHEQAGANANLYWGLRNKAWRLRSKAEANMKGLEQNWGRQNPTESSRLYRLGHLGSCGAVPGHPGTQFWEFRNYRVTRPQFLAHPRQPRKSLVGQLQTSNQFISQTAWWTEDKF
jgi:hypothetical protein